MPLNRHPARVNCWTNSAPKASPSGRHRRKRLLHHRHDVSRRSPVADGHAGSHVRHAGHLQFRRAQAAQSLQRGNVGRRDVRRGAAFSSRRSLAAASKAARSDSRTFASRCCCGRRTRVGYTAYPDNVVEAFILESASQGIDIFRVFDSLNWLPNMQLPIETIRKSGQSLRGGHLLHRRHSGSETRQISSAVLHPPGERTGKDGRAHSLHQGYGRLVQTVRGRAALLGAARRSGPADSLSHA